jgi:hypothetical protein
MTLRETLTKHRTKLVPAAIGAGAPGSPSLLI